MTTIVIATHNPGKLREFDALRNAMSRDFPALADLEFVSVLDWDGVPPEENGTSFSANALIKARAASALSGLPAIADDSGLEVDALGGAPGIYSARYAGPNARDADNNARLLSELANRPASTRQARFVCHLAMVRTADDDAPMTAEGGWTGEILAAPRGAQGFGYDPLFFCPEYQLTAAEMPAELKNRLSHRAQALTRLMSQLAGISR